MGIVSEDKYVIDFKDKIEERLRPINTTQLQIQSVVNFMKALGYEENIICNKGFRKIYPVSEGLISSPEYISFNNAQILHNGICKRISGDLLNSMRLPFKFKCTTEYWMNATKEKLVAHSYLQRLRKYPYIQATNHYISLANNWEWDLRFHPQPDTY